MWRLRGISVLWMIVYMDASIGLKGANLDKLRQMSYLIRVVGLPTICMGDWNMTKEELNAKGWCSDLNITPVIPDNTEFTCKKMPRRMIDYFLVSDKFLGMISRCSADMASPWEPHFGVELEIRREHHWR